MKKLLLIVPLMLLGCAGEDREEVKKIQKAIVEAAPIADTSYDRFKEESVACINLGGVPIRSAWDGRMKDCKFPPK